MYKTALILGANGRFGRNASEALSAAGWHVRHFDRKTDDLIEAARGVDVIVNAWNPAYPDWAAQVPKLTDRVIAAAQASGAMVVIPGNVYVFGADAPERFGPDTPHLATNPLGRIRIELEAAYRASGVQTLVLRSGDYLDTQASGNWFDMVIATKAARGRFRYPGPLDRPHAWAYLPDVARAMVEICEKRHDLGPFEDVPFPGFTLTGAELGRAVNAVTPVTVAQMSWLPIRIATPFWTYARYLLEMRYLWDKPHHLDGARLREILPLFQATPLEDALTAATQPLLNPGAQAAPLAA